MPFSTSRVRWLPLIPAILAASGAVTQDLSALLGQGEVMESALSSYNYLRFQSAACKLLGFNTISRSTSSGPAAFLSGNMIITFLTGISTQVFGHDREGEQLPSWNGAIEGQYSCGMCLEVYHADNMPRINGELTQWDWAMGMPTPFVVMVADSCSDPVCQTSPGYLDLDVFAEAQPVEHGNPRNTAWRAVPCPVGDTPLEILLCTSDTCNAQNPEEGITSFLRDRLANTWSLTVMFRNQCLPLIEVKLANLGVLQYVAGLGYLIPMASKGVQSDGVRWEHRRAGRARAES